MLQLSGEKSLGPAVGKLFPVAHLDPFGPWGDSQSMIAGLQAISITNNYNSDPYVIIKVCMRLKLVLVQFDHYGFVHKEARSYAPSWAVQAFVGSTKLC